MPQARNVRMVLCVIVLFFIGIVADSAGFTVSQEVGAVALASEGNVDGVWSIIVSLWAFLSFQVQGSVPLVISFGIFIITLVLILDLISVLKGWLPFTSGE